MNLFQIWASGSGVKCRLKDFLSGALATLEFNPVLTSKKVDNIFSK